MWLVGLLRSACLLAALTQSVQGGERYSTGEVVLADWPYCNVFVFQTGRTFSVAEWKDGLWLYQEGDAVAGPLDDPGEFVIWIDNALRGGEMVVDIGRTRVGWREAQTTFYDRCAIRGLRHTASVQDEPQFLAVRLHPGFSPSNLPSRSALAHRSTKIAVQVEQQPSLDVEGCEGRSLKEGTCARF